MTKINSSLPKYQKIGEHFIQQILAQQFVIGDVLPTEKELCEQFSISRHTAREALRHISKTGLVERRQGSGTTVVRTEMPETINQFVSSIEDLMQYGNATIFKLKNSDMVKVGEELAEKLNCQINQQCIHLAGVRVEPHDKKPVCFTNIYRQPHQDSLDDGFKKPEQAVKTLIKALSVNKVSRVEQCIQACLMPRELADELNTKENSAAMKITRRYIGNDGEDIILVAESTFPAKRFSYNSVLVR